MPPEYTEIPFLTSIPDNTVSPSDTTIPLVAVINPDETNTLSTGFHVAYFPLLINTYPSRPYVVPS